MYGSNLKLPLHSHIAAGQDRRLVCSGPKSSTVDSRGTSNSGHRVTATTAVKEEVGRWQAAFSLGAHGCVGCRVDGCARPSAALGLGRRVGGASSARR